MAVTSRRRQYTGRREMYVYGSAAPNPSYEPERRHDTISSVPKKKTSAQVRRNRRQARHMNMAYMIFLTFAAIIALVACVNMVKLQSSITSRTKNITALQEELADLKEANNTKYNAVMDSVNLDEIRTKAQEELGMVYASPEEIITYDSTAADYVEQYEAIPQDGVLAQSDDKTK